MQDLLYIAPWIILLIITTSAGYSDVRPASTIYTDGVIITMNDSMPTAEAVMVEDGIITAVGNKNDVMKLRRKNTMIVPLGTHVLLPGFIDAHSHISLIGQYADLSPAQGCVSVPSLIAHGKKAFAEWMKRCESEATFEDGDWFVGTGYDNTSFPEATHPTANDLDSISTTVPVCLIHTSNHVAVVNHRGLEALGYVKDGEITRNLAHYLGMDKEGNPNGLIEEVAFFRLFFEPNILSNSMKTNSQNPDELLKEAMQMYASYGITTAQDGAGSNIAQTARQVIEEEGELLIDIESYGSPEAMTRPSIKSPLEKGFRKAGVKIVLDGSPQAKTAWLNEPYYIVPQGKSADYRGVPTMKDEEVYAVMVTCLKNGYQLYAHTNGSAAIEQFIRNYIKACNDTGIHTDLRPVLIHAQTITSKQLKEAVQAGINVSFFNDHVYYWGDYYLHSILGPERAQRISPLAEAIRYPINVTIHQDSPVVPPNIIFSIHNAVNRRTRNGIRLGPEYAVSPMEALKMVTINGAYQYFEERRKGSIEKGKVADFVILDHNPLTVPKDFIKNIRIVETIKNGKSIFKIISPVLEEVP